MDERLFPGEEPTNEYERPDPGARTILLVGEYPILLQTRAALLSGWKTTLADTRAASAAVLSRPYDLLVICQTVSNENARNLIAQATKLYPGIKSLAICQWGADRDVSSAKYMVRLDSPGRLRDAVTELLRFKSTENFEVVASPQ